LGLRNIPKLTVRQKRRQSMLGTIDKSLSGTAPKGATRASRKGSVTTGMGAAGAGSAGSMAMTFANDGAPAGPSDLELRAAADAETSFGAGMTGTNTSSTDKSMLLATLGGGSAGHGASGSDDEEVDEKILEAARKQLEKGGPNTLAAMQRQGSSRLI
jgi:hypothetical protein